MDPKFSFSNKASKKRLSRIGFGGESLGTILDEKRLSRKASSRKFSVNLSSFNLQRSSGKSTASFSIPKEADSSTPAKTLKSMKSIKPVKTAKSIKVLEKKEIDKTEKKHNLWNKVRGAVKIAGAIGRINIETENARKMRIKRHWDLVRQISRAAISLSVITDKRDESDSRMGIRNYTRFTEVLSAHPSARTKNDIEFLMRSTKHLAFFNSKAKAVHERKRQGEQSQRPSLLQFSADLSSGSSGISEQQHFELCRTMRLRRYENSHEYIFHEGSTGEEFFIILEGSVAVQRKTGKAGIDRTVARLEAGGSFGELALTGTSVGAIRTASIVTIEPCACLVIHKDDYSRILRETHQDLLDQKLRFLRRTTAFQNLSEKDIFNLGICLHLQKVRVGTTIIREGSQLDPLRFFIIVKRGELEVRKRVALSSREDNHHDYHPQHQQQDQQRQLSLCLMGPTEAICDSRALIAKEDPSRTYPFSVVANTLVEFYCISKHDMLGKLSPEALQDIHQRISKFPDERTVKNAYAVSMGWKQYKKDLISSVLANRKSDRKQVVLSNEAKTRARGLEAKLQSSNNKKEQTSRSSTASQKAQPQPRGPSRPSHFNRRQASHHGQHANLLSQPQPPQPRQSSNTAPDPHCRKSIFERSLTNTDGSNALYSRVSAQKGLKRSESKKQLINWKREAMAIDNDDSSTLKTYKRNKKAAAAERHKQRQEYAKAAQEMQEFLEDGFTLTRHVYDNALSEGARFYCKSIVWT